MINKEIFGIADQLKNVVDQQMKLAKEAIANIPEGETKNNLQDLLKRASSGKVTHADAQREIQNIMKNANKN